MMRTIPNTISVRANILQVLYDKQNGTIIFLDERSLCFRREYSSVFLIKEALTVQDKTTIRLEIPAEEVCWTIVFYSDSCKVSTERSE